MRMSFILKRFMCSWAGKFKVGLAFGMALLLLVPAGPAAAASEDADIQFNTNRWEEFAYQVELQKARDYRNGLSYVISGALAVVGGFLGSNITEDPMEKGIYTVFETIGIASVGYGAYTWQIGGEERSFYQILQGSRLTIEQKTQLLRSFAFAKKEREKRDRMIRAITHGLIAGLNIYSAATAQNDSLKTGLYFIGGVNLLAAVSFTFEF